MPDESKKIFGALPGWIAAIIAIATILVAAGGIYDRVCIASDVNHRQDISISALERDMAVMKSTTARTALDVEEIKRDVKTLLQRKGDT